MLNSQFAILASCLACLASWETRASSVPPAACLSPAALAASPDGQSLFIACATANQVAVFNRQTGGLTKRISVPASPSGLALSPEGARLYVTCAAPQSTICVLDTVSGKTLAAIPAGHNTLAPVLSGDGRTLFVCDRFNDAVAVIDLTSRKETSRIQVQREPVAAAITPDGKLLFVANHLPAGRSDLDVVAAAVSVIDTGARTVLKHIPLPSGSTLLRGVCISPDGRFAAVTHVLARFNLPTTQIERGWIMSNALSLIDVAQMKLLNTVLLDNISSGAANPWAVAWTADGRFICATHAGTHELSVIDAPGLLAKLASLPAQLDPRASLNSSPTSPTVADVPNDLAFLVGLRTRISLPGNGPRALALAGPAVYIANYFSDSLCTVDLSKKSTAPVSLPLNLDSPESWRRFPLSPSEGERAGVRGPLLPGGSGAQSASNGRGVLSMAPSVARKGEMLFNDATLCFQSWLSCASCHSSDARVDGLNWDLLNDGIGNPKNSRSLLMSFQTPPSMALGVRPNAAAAVRAGIRHTLFTVLPEDYPAAIDQYLQSLTPMPSPHLVKGRLSASARRGEKLFSDAVVGCAECHPAPRFTDLKVHPVGTLGKYDRPADIFYTPTLVEVWRTAPYLHDGSAATMRDALTTGNRDDQHGKTSHLKPEQIEDLVEYVLSL
jgi:YVTN family beta-propeller protein